MPHLNKTKLSLLLAVALCLSASPSWGDQNTLAGFTKIAQESSKTNSWQDFRSKTGRFSAAFPGKPTTQNREGAYVYSANNTDEGIFMVTYVDAPNAESTEFLARVMPAEFARGLGGKITSEKDISIQNKSVKEFLFTTGFGFDLLKNGTGRIYTVDKRVYLILAVSPEQLSKQFLNSFKVTS
jgi:hypothetical protein